jgi:hypothetical protein
MMGSIFKSDFHEECTWLIAYIPCGGLDFGDIQAVGKAIDEGDDSAFYEAWIAAGDKFATEAQGALDAGRQVSARELFFLGQLCVCDSLSAAFRRTGRSSNTGSLSQIEWCL